MESLCIDPNFFFNSALVGGEWSALHSCHFIPDDRAHGILWKGGWVTLRVGLHSVEERKFLILERLYYPT
jgi:hypothetical protein